MKRLINFVRNKSLNLLQNQPKQEISPSSSSVERSKTSRLKISLNRHHKNKRVAKQRHYSSGFTPEVVSLDGLIQSIKKGYAWSCATYQGNYRSIDNFIEAELIAIDIDGGLSLAEALKHPFVQQYCLLIYTSPSHQKWKDGKPPCDRYRLIFLLPHPITDPEVYKHAVKQVGQAVGTYDQAATDAARYWCGNTTAHIIPLNGQPLPIDLIEQAQDKATEEREAKEKAKTEQKTVLESLDPDIIKKTVQDILLVQKLIEPRRPGTGTYEESRNVCFALSSVFERDEAVAIAEAWSPPFKYQGGYWNPASIIDADIRNRGKTAKKPVTVFTLFKLAVERGYQLPSELMTGEDLEQYLHKCRQAWQKTKQFTPDQLINNQPWFKMEAPKAGTITCIKAGLGLGKTTQLRKWLKTVWKDDSAISLGYRNTLLYQFVANTDRDFKNDYHRQFKHLHRDNLEINWLSDTLRVVACIESLEHFKPEDFDDAILILDEVVSVLKTLLFSRTIRNRGKKIQLFIEAIQRAKLVVCFDGNLADQYCDFLANCDPSKKLVKVSCQNLGDKPPLRLLEGTLTEDDILKDQDYSLWIYQLLNRSQVPAVASDSQILIEAIDNLFESQGKQGLRIDSKTIATQEVQAFLKNPNQWILDNRPQYLLYSPSAESGLTCDLKGYFTDFYAFLFGVLDVDSSTQMIARLRDLTLQRYLWVNPWIKPNNPDTVHSPLAYILDYHRQQRLNKDINLALDNHLDCASELFGYFQNNSYLAADQLFSQVQAMRNWEKSNFRESLYWILEQSGYDISDRVVALQGIDEVDSTRKQLKQQKKAVKWQNAEDIFHASDKYLGKSNTLLNFEAGWEERCALMKAKLIDKLPNIHLTEYWNAEFIYTVLYDCPDLIYRLEDRYLLIHPDKAKGKAQEIYHSLLLKGRKGEKLTPWTSRPQYLRIKTLEKVGIFDFITEVKGEELTAEHWAVQKLFSICQKKAIWQALGKKPNKDPIKYLRWLLSLIGYGLVDSKVKRNGETLRIYSVCSAPHKKVGHLVYPIMEAIARRYEVPQPILNWNEGIDTTSSEDITEKGGQNDDLIVSDIDPPQTQSEHELESVALSPQFLNESQEEMPPQSDTTKREIGRAHV